MSQRCKPAQGFAVIQGCFGCGELFSLNHRCRAVNERCSECNLFGHFTEFCQNPCRIQYSQCSDGTQESGYQESCVQDLDPRVCIASYERTVDRRNVMQGMDPCVPLPSKEEVGLEKKHNQDRNHGHQNLLSPRLSQDCDIGQRRNAEDQHQCNKSVQTDQIQEKSEDTASVQTQQTIENLTRDRDLLYNYVRKLETHVENILQKDSQLAKENCSIIDTLYEQYSPDKVPSWFARGCKNCGSSTKHLPEDCVARGNKCWNCGLRNHFTTVCKGRDKLALDVASEEREVLRNVALEMIKSQK